MTIEPITIDYPSDYQPYRADEIAAVLQGCGIPMEHVQKSVLTFTASRDEEGTLVTTRLDEQGVAVDTTYHILNGSRFMEAWLAYGNFPLYGGCGMTIEIAPHEYVTVSIDYLVAKPMLTTDLLAKLEFTEGRVI